jgi:GntR family transcriptional repressor for pyruvate dehydrogenase complex
LSSASEAERTAGDAFSSLGSPELSLRRVKRAYEQIADQLRELILVGKLKPGMRLPTEVELALQLGVGRSTVREALRQLSAEGLIRTAKGTGGGSYVSQPSLDRISSYLSTNISLLSNSAELSLAEFLEARELLEIPAARLAATRRSPEQLERLQSSIPDGPQELTTSQQFVLNRDFHSTIVDICANSLLSLAAAPVFLVLQTRLARTSLDDSFHRSINNHHRLIAAAIEAGDPDAAAGVMAEHLEWLRPAYERAWRSIEVDR